MVEVWIGQDKREWQSRSDVDAQWVNTEFRKRRDSGLPTCVRVGVKVSGVPLNLATPTCGGGGGGRPPRPKELEVLELWDKAGLNSRTFNGGCLVSFLKHLFTYLDR